MLNAILILMSAAIIVLILLQPSKSGDAGSMLSGGRDLSLFKNSKSRGAIHTVEVLTWVFVIAYLVLVTASHIMG